jgi:hypothetical protein
MLLPFARPQFFTDAGAVAASYRLFFYVNGTFGSTNTKQDTYNGYGGSANPNPITLDSAGRPDNSGTPIDIYLTPGLSYTVVLAPPGTDDPPASTEWQVDDVTADSGDLSEWRGSYTAVYVDSDTFKIEGVDVSTQFAVGTPVKLTGGADRYAIVSAVSFSTNTTIDVGNITDSSGVASTLHASMTTAYYGSQLKIDQASDIPFTSKAEAVKFTPVNGKVYFIGGTDGGWFYGVTGAAPGTYSDDGGSYCGTVFIPTGGDGTAAWVRSNAKPVSVAWYGADGSSTDITAFNNASTAAGIFGTIIMPNIGVAYNLTAPFSPLLGQRVMGEMGYNYLDGSGTRIKCDYDNTGSTFINFTSIASLENCVVDMNGKAGLAIGGSAIFRLETVSVLDAFNGIELHSVSDISNVFIQGQQTVAGIKTLSDGSFGLKTSTDSRVSRVEVAVGFEFGAILTGSNCIVSQLYSDQNRVGILLDAFAGQLVDSRANFNWDRGLMIGNGASTNPHIRGFGISSLQVARTGEDRTGGASHNGSASHVEINTSVGYLEGNINGLICDASTTTAYSPLALTTSGAITNINISDSNLVGITGAESLSIGHTGILQFSNTLIKESGSDYTYLYKLFNGTSAEKSVTSTDIVSTLSQVTTPVSNTGSGTENLIGYTLPAGSIVKTNNGLRIIAQGTTASNANAKTVKFSVYESDTGTVDLVSQSLPTSLVVDWRIEVDIIRTGADAQVYHGVMHYQSASGVWSAKPFDGSLTLTESHAWSLLGRCTAVAANDVTQSYFSSIFV